MIISSLPYWVGILLCTIVLGVNVIIVLKTSVAINVVNDIDEKVKENTLFIKSLTVDAEHLMNTVKNPELKAEVKKVYEAVRYSDSMSHLELVETELKIKKTFTEFSNAVNNEINEDVFYFSAKIISLIDLRNKNCKLLK